MTGKTRLLAGLALALVFNQAAADGLPDCRDARGKAVHYEEVTRGALHDSGFGLAKAYQDHSGQPFIAYDNERLPGLAPELRAQVLQHECAHHELGHLYLPSSQIRREREKLEEEADCRSIRVLARERGYGSREIDRIADALDVLYPSDPASPIRWEMPDRRKILNKCLRR